MVSNFVVVDVVFVVAFVVVTVVVVVDVVFVVAFVVVTVVVVTLEQRKL